MAGTESIAAALRIRIEAARERLGPDLDYSHANKHDVRRVAKIKVDVMELTALLEELDRLRALSKSLCELCKTGAP